MSSLLNKAKVKLEQTLDKNNNQPDNPHSSNAGPHSSNLVNKADPYVDSDRDHRNDPTSRVGGVGSTQEYSNIHGQQTALGGAGGVDQGYGHTGAHTGAHTGGHVGGLTSGHTTGHNVGHTEHTGGLAGQGIGHTGHTGHTGGLTGHSTGHTGPAVGHHETTTGLSGAAGGGYGGASNTYDNPQSANTGPHRSNLANKLDPRVDSDRDNRNDPTSRVGGYGTQADTQGHNTGALGTHGGHGVQHNTHGQHTGIPGTHGGQGVHQGTYGHDTGVPGTHGAVGGNTGYGPGATTGAHGGQGYSSATPGTGNAANTAGPHNSDLLNKLDPRVDADLDGSKTYGGNATYR